MSSQSKEIYEQIEGNQMEDQVQYDNEEMRSKLRIQNKDNIKDIESKLQKDVISKSQDQKSFQNTMLSQKNGFINNSQLFSTGYTSFQTHSQKQNQAVADNIRRFKVNKNHNKNVEYTLNEKSSKFQISERSSAQELSESSKINISTIEQIQQNKSNYLEVKDIEYVKQLQNYVENDININNDYNKIGFIFPSMLSSKQNIKSHQLLQYTDKLQNTQNNNIKIDKKTKSVYKDYYQRIGGISTFKNDLLKSVQTLPSYAKLNSPSNVSIQNQQIKITNEDVRKLFESKEFHYSQKDGPVSFNAIDKLLLQKQQDQFNLKSSNCKSMQDRKISNNFDWKTKKQQEILIENLSEDNLPLDIEVRQRIFEDVIIQRVKTLQNHVNIAKYAARMKLIGEKIQAQPNQDVIKQLQNFQLVINQVQEDLENLKHKEVPINSQQETLFIQQIENLGSQIERRFVEEEFKMSEIEKWTSKEFKNIRNEFQQNLNQNLHQIIEQQDIKIQQKLILNEKITNKNNQQNEQNSQIVQIMIQKFENSFRNEIYQEMQRQISNQIQQNNKSYTDIQLTSTLQKIQSIDEQNKVKQQNLEEKLNLIQTQNQLKIDYLYEDFRIQLNNFSLKNIDQNDKQMKENIKILDQLQNQLVQQSQRDFFTSEKYTQIQNMINEVKMTFDSQLKTQIQNFWDSQNSHFNIIDQKLNESQKQNQKVYEEIKSNIKEQSKIIEKLNEEIKGQKKYQELENMKVNQIENKIQDVNNIIEKQISIELEKIKSDLTDEKESSKVCSQQINEIFKNITFREMNITQVFQDISQIQIQIQELQNFQNNFMQQIQTFTKQSNSSQTQQQATRSLSPGFSKRSSLPFRKSILRLKKAYNEDSNLEKSQLIVEEIQFNHFNLEKDKNNQLSQIQLNQSMQEETNNSNIKDQQQNNQFKNHSPLRNFKFLQDQIDKNEINLTPISNCKDSSRKLCIDKKQSLHSTQGYVSIDVGAISEDQEQFNKNMPHDPLDNQIQNEHLAINISHNIENQNRYLVIENFENNQLNEESSRHSKYFQQNENSTYNLNLQQQNQHVQNEMYIDSSYKQSSDEKWNQNFFIQKIQHQYKKQLQIKSVFKQKSKDAKEAANLKQESLLQSIQKKVVQNIVNLSQCIPQSNQCSFTDESPQSPTIHLNQYQNEYGQSIQNQKIIQQLLASQNEQKEKKQLGNSKKIVSAASIVKQSAFGAINILNNNSQRDSIVSTHQNSIQNNIQKVQNYRIESLLASSSMSKSTNKNDAQKLNQLMKKSEKFTINQNKKIKQSSSQQNEFQIQKIKIQNNGQMIEEVKLSQQIELKNVNNKNIKHQKNSLSFAEKVIQPCKKEQLRNQTVGRFIQDQLSNQDYQSTYGMLKSQNQRSSDIQTQKQNQVDLF